MATLLQDLQYGIRQLRSNPGFTLAAVLCIALGIGGNSAAFSISYALLFQQSPAQDPDRLVRIYGKWANGISYGSFSYPDYLDLRGRNEIFSGLVMESIAPFNLSAADRNDRIWGQVVSGNYFSELGIRPILGRGFLPEEDRTQGTHPVVVISRSLWKNRFGSDPGVINKTVRLNGRPFSIIGVGPDGFHGTTVGLGGDLWVPVSMFEQLFPGRPWLTRRGSHWIQGVIGRLKPGVAIGQAASRVNAIMAQLAEQYPDTNKGLSAIVYRDSEARLHPAVRDSFVNFMALIFAVVGAVLLLACTNVAGLLLARSSARRKEISVRMALGASRGRLVRQLLAESVVLSSLGGAAGFVLGMWLVRLIQSVQPPSDIPMQFHIALEWRVIVFTLVVTLLTGILFGLAPALASARHDLVTTLKDGAPLLGGSTARVRKVLVGGQVALSFVLMVGAALLVQSLQNVRNLDLGFSPNNQFMGVLQLELNQYDKARVQQFMQSLKQRIESLPGVAAVGFADNVILNLSSQQMGVRPEGYQPPSEANYPSIDYNFIDEGYLKAMGIAVLQGRGFAATDDANAAPVMLVNQAFAQRFWPGEDPIGKRVRTAGKEHQIVGVVKTGKYFSIGEAPRAFMYLPIRQNYTGNLVFHVRTMGDPGSLMEAVRKEVRFLDNTLPAAELKTMNSALGLALLPARLGAAVVSAFAFLALFLASVGLYGVIAHFVSQGTRDIGIRMAIGARPSQVLSLVLRQGMVTTLVGLGAGLLAALAASRLMSGFLYGISGTDPISYVAAVFVLAMVSSAAVLVPARRATRIDPAIALRES